MSNNYCSLRSKFCYNADSLGQCTITAPCVDTKTYPIITNSPSENYVSIRFINTCPKCGCQFENTGEVISKYAQVIRWYEKVFCVGCEVYSPHAKCGNCGKEFLNPLAVSKFCPDCGREMIEVHDESNY